jgi:hypothetical protein
MVDLPAEEVPPELPEPVLGINFARDGMDKKDWLALVAVHSDAWLMSVAFYFASKMDAAGRCCTEKELWNFVFSSRTELALTVRLCSGSSKGAYLQQDQRVSNVI